ncbi:F-box protein [Canna indica]|uniref:F-box protein n=1 Tax=Canna indica TaxID=4628 RepID=A0AAQ3KA08_9LILI|nr:F-box protein [Canna indica]
MVLLVETHLNDEQSDVCIRKSGNNWEGISELGNGRSRGMVLVWKKNTMKMELIYKCSQTIHVAICRSGGKPWLLTGRIKHLRRLASDHRPILVDTRQDRKGDQIECFERKLELLGVELKKWSKDNVGSLENNLKETMDELEVLKSIDEKGCLSDEEMLRMKCLTNKALALNRQIHIKLWSRARTSWVEMNDKNTRYFHNLVKYKQRLNTISEVVIDGNICTDTKDILNGFLEWYKELWGVEERDEVNWQSLRDLKWKKIPKQEHKRLIKIFTEEEVRQAMQSMGKEKAPESRRTKISRLLGIKEGGLPIKYLGAQITKGKVPINIQRQMIEKAECKLDSWASKEISHAGKVNLINFVMNSMSIHTLATTWINEKVIKEHDKLVRNYLWKGGKNKVGFHLIKWKKVVLSKAEGGLGVKDLSSFRTAILAKRILPILNKKDQLWCKLINAKYQGLHP